MLTIVGWLWRQDQMATVYNIDHANTWARMIHRNLTIPHRFKIFTDFPQDEWKDFIPLIEPAKLWDDWRDVKNPLWPPIKPQCYVRLKVFSREAREWIGERFVSIDLD